MLIAALPVIGWIMIIIWAIKGENETRKNYFRAILAWAAVGMAAVSLYIALMGIPQIQKKVQGWTHKGS